MSNVPSRYNSAHTAEEDDVGPTSVKMNASEDISAKAAGGGAEDRQTKPDISAPEPLSSIASAPKSRPPKLRPVRANMPSPVLASKAASIMKTTPSCGVGWSRCGRNGAIGSRSRCGDGVGAAGVVLGCLCVRWAPCLGLVDK